MNLSWMALGPAALLALSPQDATSSRVPDPLAIGLPPGFAIQVVARGLDAPSCVFVDGDDRVYIVESGEPVGTAPRILRIAADGSVTEVARGTRHPWTGATWAKGAYFVSEGGSPGRVLRIRDGKVTVLVDDLPNGDHHTNQPVVGPDGWIYFGNGTVTNSGIVGEDSATMGWLAGNPTGHDVPGEDIVLTGKNFGCDDPRPRADREEILTGAYVPIGTATTAGQTIEGNVRCSGSILRVHPDDGRLELVAWGLRNPFDLAFDAGDRLIATENGADRRGSRPIFGAPDCIWAVERGTWYGWPDYFAGMPATDGRFESGDQPEFLLAKHPGAVPKPRALLPVHASADGIAISTNAKFGHVGEAFVAEFGDMAPAVGALLANVGFMIVRVDLKSGANEAFAVNRGDANGPASELGGGGFERPIDVCFDRAGTTLYVADFGALDPDTMKPVAGTGVLWSITRRATTEGP